MRYASKRPPLGGSACCGPAGETTANSTFRIFVTGLSTRHSEGLQTPKTGRTDSSCDFGLEKVAPAYDFDDGNGCDSISEILGPFWQFLAEPHGWPVNAESGGCECPFGINVDNVRASVDTQQVATARTRPVVPLGWRKLRWLKRRRMAVHSGSFGLSQAGSVTTHLSSSLSSGLSICPPLVRPAPGVSSFPSLPVPSPPAHSAHCGDDVGDRLLSFGAGASVARPCLSLSFASVGSSASSIEHQNRCAENLSMRLLPSSSSDSSPSAGPSRLPSRSVASTRRSVRFHQSKSGNVSAQGGQRIAAASSSGSGVVPVRPSNMVVLNRQVTIVDLGLADSNVATHKPMPRNKQTLGSPSGVGDIGGCLLFGALDGPVVGSLVFGRQPQRWPSSLHCVLRLRGGASSTSSSDDGAATTFGHDGGVDSVLPDFHEAVGSGVGDDHGNLAGDYGEATRKRFAEPRVTEVSRPIAAPVGEESFVIEVRHGWPAGVPAQKEGYRVRVVEEHIPHRVDYIFSPLNWYPRYEVARSEARPPSSPPGIPQDGSSASSSGYP